MALRLEPADELMHELGPEQNFNESMYFNLYDPAARLGGWFRLGNRANEGYAELTVCLYLPDGRVAFMFKRPEIADNDAFRAGGMGFSVARPFEELDVGYDGKVVLLDEPLQMADPKAAFTSNPYEACEVRLRYLGRSTPVGGEPEQGRERPGEEFARGHYEQLVEAVGTVRVGTEEWDVRGWGLRDHSWGPRYWQAPWYYRWLTANFGPDAGLMVSRIARREGHGTRGGFVWEDGTMHLCDEAQITTTWTEDANQSDLEASLRGGGREWRVRGRVINLIPLRNRRTTPEGDVLLTRIGEGLTEWTLS
ncbi:MAG: hypothetical protein JOZ41_07165, partial [Chloroflexi bacterium]|nr:hypothetical protein [Chloroflexota bacterium]